MLYPWNSAIANRFAHDRARLSHALLFAGPRGLGKSALATWLSQLLLCDEAVAPAAPCGNCHGCKLFAAGSHPDIHVVLPDALAKSSQSLLARYAQRYVGEDKGREGKESAAIRVDQIRTLIANSQTRPQIARSRVVILSPAESLNTNAANSLLKLLEEPPPDTFLILIADTPGRMPATLRSRCTKIVFSLPERGVSRAWLEDAGVKPDRGDLLLSLTGNAPLLALELHNSDFPEQRSDLLNDLENLKNGQGDPIACASRWKALGAERSLAWFAGWLADLATLKVCRTPVNLRNPDLLPRLQALEKRLHFGELVRFHALAIQSRAGLGGSLDEGLILEDILISWTQSPVHAQTTS